jgi:hypothetical protein
MIKRISNFEAEQFTNANIIKSRSQRKLMILSIRLDETRRFIKDCQIAFIN